MSFVDFNCRSNFWYSSQKGRKKEKDADRNDSISSPSLESMGSPGENSTALDDAPPKSTRTRVSGWADETPSGSAK